MDNKLRKQEERILFIIISLLTLSLIFLAGKPAFTGLVIGNATPNITENISVNESMNVTITNITQNVSEIPKLNITNITFIQDQEEAVLETTISKVEINKPVKWTKKIDASKVKEFKLPEKAFNVKGSNYNAKKQEFDLENVDEVIEIEYFTEAPKVKEKIITKNKKQITVSADLDYENVLTYTDIPESREELIKVYWLKDSGKELFTDIDYIDTNNNDLIDRLEWTIPHLSNQTFEIIIEITKAEHLDEDRKYISDIYDEVIELDDDWSERIYHNEYVSVTFEKNLTSENDITVYVRNNQQLNTKIEVYYYNSAVKITEFPIIQETEYYKIYLNNLQGTSLSLIILLIQVCL